MIAQGTPEWHQARIGRVTGSTAGAILGLSPFATRADTMRAMVRAAKGAPSEFVTNPAVEWGKSNEAGAIVDFEMETSERVTPVPFIPHDCWLGASPDGYVSDGKLLEVKCLYGIRNDPEPEFKRVSEYPHYVAQMNIEAYCAGVNSVWFYRWTPHATCLKLHHRDDEWLEENLPILKSFWDEYVAIVNDPDACEEHLSPRRTIIDTPAAAMMVAEYDQLSEAIDLATERKKELLAEIAAMAGERDALVAGRKLTLVKKEGAVSYAKALKALAPDADLSKWKGKPSEHWKLT